MMKFKKFCMAILCLVLTCLCLSACGGIEIPPIVNVDEATAKNILSSNGLIPAVKYENSEDVAKGCVIRTEPTIGSSVEKNSVVTIYISDGPQLTVPDVKGTDESTAKNILSSNSLIPQVVYEYSDTVEKGCVIRTSPEIGSKISPNSKVTVYISDGPYYYELKKSLAIIYNVDGIKDFLWDDEAPNGEGTKGHYLPYVRDGYLHLPVFLKCTSKYKLEFYDDWGVASINDTFDKTVPIDVIYISKQIDNNGGLTEFEFKVPLTDLGVQKPTNLSVRTDFLVNGERTTFEVSYDLTW